MTFLDRADAGRQLASQLLEFAHRSDAIVLEIPRGGVVVAAEIARALHLPLDIFLSHKLGVPAQPELAFGAIAANGARYLDEQLIQSEHISLEEVDRIAAEVRELLDQRALRYRGNRPPLNVSGRTVILADDGIATGASVFAAIQALRELRPAAIVLAVPVAPAPTCAWLRRFVDSVVCLCAPDNFVAVGQFYVNFSQTTDDDICQLLDAA